MSRLFNEITSNLRRVHVYSSVRGTPSFAAELLTLNTGNRPFTERYAKDIATDMKRGDWRFNGDMNVRISKTGKLLNGQHTLTGIVWSDTEQVLNIQTGLDDDVFDLIDIHKRRSARDVLHIAGFSNGSVISGAIRIIKAYNDGRLGNVRLDEIRGTKRITNHDLVQWMKTNDANLMQECARQGTNLYVKPKLLSPGIICAFLYLFSRRNRDAAQFFWNAFSTGENLSTSSNPAIYLLREKAITWVSNRAITNTEKFACIIKAWNAYRAGTDIRRLTWSIDRDEFPRISN